VLRIAQAGAAQKLTGLSTAASALCYVRAKAALELHESMPQAARILSATGQERAGIRPEFMRRISPKAHAQISPKLPCSEQGRAEKPEIRNEILAEMLPLKFAVKSKTKFPRIPRRNEIVIDP